MKKIFNFSVLLFGLAVIGLVSCAPEELSTDQYSDETVALSAFGPNPVMRGAALTILGSNLDKVAEVHLPGIDPITEFDEVVAGAHGSLKVTVPVQAPDDVPAVGVVTIVDQNGQSHSSLTELSYTEAFKIDSFSPAEVHPGDKVTVKGDYLYNVKEVALYKDAENRAYGLDLKVTRKQLTFIVPDDATTGQFIISDVDHNNNPDNLIPNEIFSGKDLKMLDPVVTPFKTKAFKSGQTVTITGEHLGMISKVVFAGAETDELTVSEDRKTLTVALPEKATDGEVTAVTYEGHSFKAGEITTIIPTGLAVAAETRYKAGLNVVVTGKDLDLVTGVKVADVDAKFTTAEKKTVVVLPAESPDGDVVLSLANGKTVTAGAIEVVKPVIESLSVATIVAGDSLIVKGTDLDLVTAVEISEQPCEFKLEEKDLKVYVSRVALTGDLVVKAANKSTSAAPIEVTYDESIAVTEMPSKIEVKSNFVFKGTNLGQIEAIYIDGVKVIAYTTRTDTECGFMLPDDVTPGFYTMEIVLISGETLTWAIPFEVTGKYKLTPVWEAPGGQIDLTWGNPRPTVPVAVFENLPKGSSLIFCFTQKVDTWGQVQINNGIWEGLVFPEIGSNTLVPTDYYGWSFDYRELEVQLTEDIIAKILANAGDFEGVQTGIIIQGENVSFNKILLKTPAEAVEVVLWEGEAVADEWKDQPYILSDGGEELSNAGAQPGQTLYLYAEPLSADWKLELCDGHWTEGIPTYWSLCSIGNDTESGKFTEYDLAANDGKFSIVLTKEILDRAYVKQGWGGVFVLNGDNMKVTKVTLM